MSKTEHTVQQYWDERSDLFGDYYLKPSLFDKIFRKAVYTREAVAVKTCKELETPTVLDIGSGPGVNSISILKNSSAKHVFGIDFAPNMIEYAEELAKKEGHQDSTTFVEGDFMNYDFDTKIFDVSIALGVLDYIGPAQSFLTKMVGVTNKACVISWPENGLRMGLRRYRYTCPLYHYNLDQILNLHKVAGIDSSMVEVVRVPGGWVTIGFKQ